MMKHLTSFSFLIFLFGLILSPTFEVNAAAPGSETGGIQQAEPTDQDREYCASMIRFGKEAFQRGRYLDAKQFFRQAIEADRTNSKAWLYYDRTVIFALAEKVEQGSSLLAPGRSLSSSSENTSLVQTEQAALPLVPLAESEEEEEEEEEEGC